MTLPKANAPGVSDQAKNENPTQAEPLHGTSMADMAAPTEPALLDQDGTFGGAPPIKQATLYPASEERDGSAPPLRHIESYVGFVLDGRYHIESIIAQGGMGVVYLARHRLIDKYVAVKILRPELANNREITARFLTEAQAASAIGSEHIVNVTDYGELPDGATYIVMEYLNGLSLNQRIRQSNGPLPIPVVLDIARQIAEGLQQAHDANIVHRDLKPDNILLVTKAKRDDFVKILDFGIAKVQSSQNHTTTAGRIFGTPHYMSPEQGRGQDLNHRTDIYALGVILYEMVCGSVPFEGENPLGILTQHMYVDAKPLSERCSPERVTPALECVVARCLLKDPAGRYESMAALDEDLRRLQNFEPPLAVDYFKSLTDPPAYLVPILRLAQAPKRGRRAWGLALAGALLAAMGGVYVSQNSAPEGAQTSAESAPQASGLELATVEVTIVAEPIDAHIFENEVELGVNPHTLRVVPHETRVVTVRRPGYRDLVVTIDGTQTRVEAKLKRIAGAEAPRVNDAPPSASLATTVAAAVASMPSDKATAAPGAALPSAEPDPPAAQPNAPPASAAQTSQPTPLPAVMQPPDAIDPAWGYAPSPPGPPPSAREPEAQTREPAPHAPAPPGPPPIGFDNAP